MSALIWIGLVQTPLTDRATTDSAHWLTVLLGKPLDTSHWQCSLIDNTGSTHWECSLIDITHWQCSLTDSTHWQYSLIVTRTLSNPSSSSHHVRIMYDRHVIPPVYPPTPTHTHHCAWCPRVIWANHFRYRRRSRRRSVHVMRYTSSSVTGIVCPSHQLSRSYPCLGWAAGGGGGGWHGYPLPH